ncbi:hypothetical protein, partial [Desulfovibrio sp. 1214_IL3152]|uniref:hypothetical protein n=1 Tax=Desulfovibrio sp. 1214_IL3152 TaxID=3084056 RepID=UPI002FDAB1D5
DRRAVAALAGRRRSRGAQSVGLRKAALFSQLLPMGIAAVFMYSVRDGPAARRMFRRLLHL